ncbi:hypothetical protein WR25_00062 [Diploscapter pachys]|uniref:Sugar phosphate transporter domain-containing protein n=1 Tax=Diploscapter pachys TaxID=2018661 RepID=A0A2A2KE81_9BILA|nr:hypothetical protein WR25_00062 [Diploscapter pachys]
MYSLVVTKRRDETTTAAGVHQIGRDQEQQQQSRDSGGRTSSNVAEDDSEMTVSEASLWKRVGSAVFYGLTSILVVFVNKILLTNFKFPSFLCVAFGQMAATVLILYVARLLGLISFPSLDSSIPRKINPLPLLYFLNLVSGLGGTQMINLPMFTVLRRFSILMTMILEYYILGFQDLGKYGLMFYNCLFMSLPALFFAIYTGDVQKTMKFVLSDDMTTPVWVCFFISCVCGFVLNYSLVLCTHHNSALTTTCVGPIKNLFVTYVGMFSSGDYVFQWTNFVGINISVAGSILYTYVTFRTKKPTSQGYRQLPTVPPILPEKSQI